MMKFQSYAYQGGIDAIWRGEAAILPGGFMLDGDIPSRSIVFRGTPVVVDFETLKCKLAKSAEILDGGTTTQVRVAKNHLFVVGDEVTDGKTAITISAIDTSEKDYDTLTLSQATEESVIYTDCKPNGVVGANHVNDGLGENVLSVSYQCLVLYAATALPIVDAWKDGIHLVGNPSIIFIRQ